MNAEILPFPAVARRRDIEKVAAEVATYSADGAERYLGQLLERYKEKLERFGVAEVSIEHEIAALRRQYDSRSAFYRATRGQGVA